MTISWMPIYGNLDITEEKIQLNPLPAAHSSSSSPIGVPLALAKSNLGFEQGEIEFEAWLPEADTSCCIGFPGGPQTEVFAGLNMLGSPYGFSILKGRVTWEPLSLSGQGSRLHPEKLYKVRVAVSGSQLELYVNDVMVTTASFPLTRGQVSAFIQSSGPAYIRNVRVLKAQRPICFVVMQFTDEFNALYSEVIKPVCESFNYTVIRADDFHTSGLIIEDITRSIQESTVVIADVTPNNPNVFYEVGFAHGIGKPTILLSDRTRGGLPFDISGFRTLFYDNTIGGKATVEERLRRHLEAIGA